MRTQDKPFVTIYAWEKRGDRLVGRVIGHPRFSDGELVTTSRLLNFNELSAETLNTNYLLGARFASVIENER